MKLLLHSLSRLLAFVLVVQLHAAAVPQLFTEGVRVTEPLSPEQQQKTFHLPPGFKIQLVAAEPDLRKPMNMAFDSAGRLWITESREYPFAATNAALARDTIRIFSDFDDHGRARKITTFATNLNIPIGIYPFRSPAKSEIGNRKSEMTWKCLAWSIPHIWLFEDTDGDGVADKQEKFLGPFDFSRDTHGNQASFRRGLDGWIYATHGFNNQSRVSGRDGHEIFLPSGNVYRFRLDGSRVEHWTHGQVNPFGLAFDPLGNLYSADCHSSPIYQLLRGAHYPSFGRPHDGLGFAPTTIQHSHGSTAIGGIVHISDPSWPAEFQDNLFIGNVLTSRINRDQLEWRGSTSVGKEKPDFLSTDDPWFRPVDLQFGPDGALWVADFYNRIIGHYEVPLLHPGRDRERGRLWRIVPPVGADVRRLKLVPDVKSTTALYKTPDLVEELGSLNPTRRLLAQQELTDCVGTDAVAMLKETARGIYDFPTLMAKNLARVHALWALLNLRQLDDLEMNTAIDDPSSLRRGHLMRLTAEISLQAAGKVVGAKPPHNPGNFRALMLMHMDDPSAHVQRAAADALAANPHSDNLPPLLALQKRVPAEDTHLTHVVRMALREQLRQPGAFAKLSGENLPPADARAFAAIATSLTNAEAASFLLRHLSSHQEPAKEWAEFIIHAARYGPETDLERIPEFLLAGPMRTKPQELAQVFKAIQSNIAARGKPLPSKLSTFGEKLVNRLLEGVEMTNLWAYVPSNPSQPGASPFGVESRNTGPSNGRFQPSGWFISSFPHGETLTGTLRSAAFALPKQLSFYLCGHDGNPNQPAGGKNSVRLRARDSGATLREAKAPRSDMASHVTWDMAELAGTMAFFEIVDGDDAKAFAWIAVGLFDPGLPALRDFFDTATLAREHQIGAELARSLKLEFAEPRIAQLFTLTPDLLVRAAAGRAWLVLNATAALPHVEPLVRDAAQPETLRAELAAQLGEAAEARGLAVVVAALTNAPTRLQTRFATALVSTAAGAEQLLAAAESGRIAARLLQDRTLTDRLRASPAREASARLAALVKNLPAADVLLHKMIEAKRAGFDAKQANAARGAEVFAKACVVCHVLEGKGALVGPQLDGIGGRGLERLLEDVLDPNRNVDKAFRTTVFVLKDGETVSGLMRREEGGAFIYALANGQEARVAKADVKERRETETSLMPANFIEALTPAELNDLLAFLLGKSGK